MAKDLYKSIGERHGVNKNERKDVKLGAVAVLHGAELTAQQQEELRLKSRIEWRHLLGWQKTLLTEALLSWLKAKKCDAILTKLDSMGEVDRHKFLSEAIRTKIKNPIRPPKKPGSTSSAERDDEDDIKVPGSPDDDSNDAMDIRRTESADGEQPDPNSRTRQISISQVLNPM